MEMTTNDAQTTVHTRLDEIYCHRTVENKLNKLIALLSRLKHINLSRAAVRRVVAGARLRMRSCDE